MERQREAWTELADAVERLVDGATAENIKDTAVSLFELNVVAARGVLVRRVMQRQRQVPLASAVLALLVAVMASKIPEIGNLAVSRVLLQYRRAHRTGLRLMCRSSTELIGCLINQKVCLDVVGLQLLQTWLSVPTDDLVQLAVGFLTTTGAALEQASPQVMLGVADRLRTMLHAGGDPRIESWLRLRKGRYRTHPRVSPSLDLVEDEDAYTSALDLADNLVLEDILSCFVFDPEWDLHQAAYAELRLQILGSGESEDESEDGGEQVAPPRTVDLTGSTATQFRKRIYLTLQNSSLAQEAVHKLLGLTPPAGIALHALVAETLVTACANEKAYSKFLARSGELLCRHDAKWEAAFAALFPQWYARSGDSTNQIRNSARFWGHLLASDRLGWEVLACVQLSDTTTTPAGRVFVKFVFAELVAQLGVPLLLERLHEEYIQPYLVGMFPTSDRAAMVFAINYWTAIGLGVVTEAMRGRIAAA